MSRTGHRCHPKAAGNVSLGHTQTSPSHWDDSEAASQVGSNWGPLPEETPCCCGVLRTDGVFGLGELCEVATSQHRSLLWQREVASRPVRQRALLAPIPGTPGPGRPSPQKVGPQRNARCPDPCHLPFVLSPPMTHPGYGQPGSRAG